MFIHIIKYLILKLNRDTSSSPESNQTQNQNRTHGLTKKHTVKTKIQNYNLSTFQTCPHSY